MSQELQTALAALIAAIVGWLVRQFTSPKPAEPQPAKPAVPTPTPDEEDPYKGLPGLPGHPVLRLLGPALLRWLGVFADTPEDDEIDDETALALIASAVRKDAERTQRLQTLLD